MTRLTILITLITIGSILTCSSCKKLDLQMDVPNCIERKIRKIRKEPVRNPPAEVWQWKFDDNTYYYFTSDCCDAFNYLYDEKCNQICAPDGGFSGVGDGNCPTFPNDIEKQLIWKDDR